MHLVLKLRYLPIGETGRLFRLPAARAPPWPRRNHRVANNCTNRSTLGAANPTSSKPVLIPMRPPVTTTACDSPYPPDVCAPDAAAAWLCVLLRRTISTNRSKNRHRDLEICITNMRILDSSMSPTVRSAPSCVSGPGIRTSSTVSEYDVDYRCMGGGAFAPVARELMLRAHHTAPRGRVVFLGQTSAYWYPMVPPMDTSTGIPWRTASRSGSAATLSPQ